MTTLLSIIGNTFLAGTAKTLFSLFEKVYRFLFIENIVYGIAAIVIVFILLIFIFRKAFNSSNEDIEYRSKRQEEIDRESTLTTTMKSYNNSSNNTIKGVDCSSDLELVAVITAAIMAHMGEDAPEDGLVIRSIRKVNRRNHVNNYSD